MWIVCAFALLLHAEEAVTSSAQREAAAFVDAMSRNGAEALAVRVENRDISGHRFVSAKETIDRFDDVEVRSFDMRVLDVTGERMKLRVDLDATAVTANYKRERRPLPSQWYLQLRRDGDRWMIESAETRERHIAWQIAETDDPKQRWALADTIANRRQLVWELGDEAYYRRGPAGEDVGLFALALAIADHDLEAERIALLALSRHARLEYQPQDGVKWAEVAWEIARPTGDCTTIADTLWALGSVYREAGRWDDGRPILLQVAEMANVIDDPRVALKARHNLAHFHVDGRNYREALIAAEGVAQLSARYGWTDGVLGSGFAKTEVWTALGYSELALAEMQKTHDQLVAIGRVDFAGGAALQVALKALELGRDRIAEEYVAKSLSYAGGDPHEVPHVLGLRVSLLIRQKQLDRAEEVVREMETYLPHTAPSGRIATVRARAQLRLAQGRAEEALGAAREIMGVSSWRDAWRDAWITAQALRRLGRTEEERLALQRTLDLIEAERALLPPGDASRIRFFENKAEPYIAMVELLQSIGRHSDALDVAERIRARTLHDGVALASVPRTATDADEARSRALNSRILELNRALLKVGNEEERTRLVTQLDATRSEFLRAQAEVDLKTWSSQATASAPIERPTPPAGTLALEYVVAPQRTILFAVTRDAKGGRTIEPHPLPIGSAELQKIVNAYAEQISERDLRYRQTARKLFDLLLRPVERSLKAARAITIIPDGDLWRVPFPSLIAADGTHVVDRYAMTVAPSLTMLAALSSRETKRRPKGELIAFANATIDGRTESSVRAVHRDATLGALPDTEREVREVAALYPRAKVFVRDDAREAIVKRDADDYRIIHIATHGLLDANAPMFSSLLFSRSPEDREDGLLEAREIADMHLNADLVVLAACDTAGGRVASGEGLVGMSWALFAAGCPTTIASQWKVSSPATAKLMVEFHRALREGKSSAEALRLAAKSLASTKTWSHPFYWAGFVAMGATR